MASSALIIPVPLMRSTKIRLRVRSPSDSARTLRVSSNAFRHKSVKSAGRSAFTPPTRQELIADSRDPRHDDAHIVAAFGNGDPKQLLHSHGVAHVVDEW